MLIASEVTTVQLYICLEFLEGFHGYPSDSRSSSSPSPSYAHKVNRAVNVSTFDICDDTVRTALTKTVMMIILHIAFTATV